MDGCDAVRCVSPGTQWNHTKNCPRASDVAKAAATKWLEEDDKKNSKNNERKRSLAEANQESNSNGPPGPILNLPALPNDDDDSKQEELSMDVDDGFESGSPSNSPPLSPLSLPTINDVHGAINIGDLNGDYNHLRSSSSSNEPPKKRAKTSLPTAIKEKLDYLFVRWVLLRAKPFSTGTEKELLEFIHYIIPSYTPPNAKAIGSQWLQKIWGEVKCSVERVCIYYLFIRVVLNNLSLCV